MKCFPSFTRSLLWLVVALSLSSPADRMKLQWGPLVKETADRISREIGHRPGSRIGVA